LYGSKDDLFASQSAKNDNGFSVRCVFGIPNPNGEVYWEKWNGSFSINTIPITTPPDESGTWAGISSPRNVGNNFAYRIRGHIYPPETGYYTFWIASDNKSELYISTNSSPSSKQLIAAVTNWTHPEEWLKYPNQKSNPVFLNNVSRYYFEILYVEDIGGVDHVEVGWSKPGEPTTTATEIIPSINLSSQGISSN